MDRKRGSGGRRECWRNGSKSCMDAFCNSNNPVDEVLTPFEAVGEEETLLAQSAKPLNGPPLLSLKYLREQRRRGCELRVLLG